MKSIDQMFRWTFNLFLFLLCFQFGVILFLYGAIHKARQTQKDKEPAVAFSCGDFDLEENYFPLANAGENLQTCLHQECPDSMWINRGAGEQAEEVHVISVVKPYPAHKSDAQLGNGHTVTVDIKNMDKPYHLVLLTQKDLTVWNLQVDEPEKIKKTIVLGPGLTWVEGLPQDQVVEYFPREKICVYPTAWEEIHNPANEFRRLGKVLEQYLQTPLTTFQGKQVGRFFSLPTLASKRGLAGAPSLPAQADSDLGLQFRRHQKRIEADEFHYAQNGQVHKIKLPHKTQDAFYEPVSKFVFMISEFRFGYWHQQKNLFHKIYVPLQLPAMRWPTSMALDSRRRQILIYNDERGGEIYIYNIKEKTWLYMGSDVGYTLAGLTYNEQQDAFFAARINGQQIRQIVKLNPMGKIVASRDLDRPLDFARSAWQVKLFVAAKNMWLKLIHPAQPEGDLHSLEHIKMSL